MTLTKMGLEHRSLILWVSALATKLLGLKLGRSPTQSLYLELVFSE